MTPAYDTLRLCGRCVFRTACGQAQVKSGGLRRRRVILPRSWRLVATDDGAAYAYARQVWAAVTVPRAPDRLRDKVDKFAGMVHDGGAAW